MMSNVRFWFRPVDGNAEALASAFRKAGHGSVSIRSSDDCVGLVPFEVSVSPSWEYVASWVADMESHFGAALVESG